MYPKLFKCLRCCYDDLARLKVSRKQRLCRQVEVSERTSICDDAKGAALQLKLAVSWGGDMQGPQAPVRRAKSGGMEFLGRDSNVLGRGSHLLQPPHHL